MNITLSVRLLLVVGVLIGLAFSLWPEDWGFISAPGSYALHLNMIAGISTTLISAGLVYLFIERKLEDERKARIRMLERRVLEEIAEYLEYIVKMVGVIADPVGSLALAMLAEGVDPIAKARPLVDALKAEEKPQFLFDVARKQRYGTDPKGIPATLHRCCRLRSVTRIVSS